MMPCLPEKLAVGAAFAALAGSGVLVVVGAPTVVLSAGGVAAAVGSLIGVAASLAFLMQCYDRRGETEKAERMARKLALLEAQLAALQAALGLA
jgi:hypothetical protein